jgi:hypothetical protein
MIKLNRGQIFILDKSCQRIEASPPETRRAGPPSIDNRPES